MDYINYAVWILAAWNLIVFALYGIDKRKSKKKKWRISEKALILTAFLLGGAGALFGMSFFRHKTKHLKFKILVPFALLINIAAIVGLYLVYTNILA